MEINAALAAELAILTEALDDPGTDVVQSLLHLAGDARTGVASYLGLMVIIAGSDPAMTVTDLEDAVQASDIRTSLMFAPPAAGLADAVPRVSLILFAGVPGALVDLAADLSWMTGCTLADVVLDQHLTIPAGAGTVARLRAASVINQAIGVLIGRGRTHEQAHRELEARAAAAGTDRHCAADLILATLPVIDVGPDLDSA